MRKPNSLMQFVLAIITVPMASLIGSNVLAQSAQMPHFTGEQLAEIHCVRCHKVPEPGDLAVEEWPLVLARMGLYLGLKGDELPEYVSSEATEPFFDNSIARKVVDTEGNEHDISGYKQFVLSDPLVSDAEWVRVRDHYVNNAPTMAEMFLTPPEHPVIEGFVPTVPELDIEPNGLVITTLVDEARQQLYVGRAQGALTNFMADSKPEDLLALDLNTGRRVGYTELDTDPTDLELTETGIRLSVHGEFPPEPGNGQAYIADWDGFDTREARARMLVNGVHRITQINTHDLNGDGLEDITVSMFGDGNLAVGEGRFSIFWQTPEFARAWQDAPDEIPHGTLEGTLSETVLMNRAGPIGFDIADFNGDDRPDIVLLAAQGLQEIVLYTNLGNGLFAEQVVDQRSPAFGGNSVYAADMDSDGHTDIVVLNGDFSTRLPIEGFTPPKHYHGLRIYRNNGDFTFDESYFYPMHGAIKSAIADYDDDGDQDIALVSTYPRWEWDMPETFVYLENQGGFEFAPATLPRENWGVWISVEAADVNADDKLDIVLGLSNWPGFVPSDWTTRDIMAGRGGEAPTILFLVNDQ